MAWSTREIAELAGTSLPAVRLAAMGEGDHHPAEALRALDAELSAKIERLARVRVELGLILRHGAPADLPADVASAARAAGMSEADRSVVLAMSRVLGPQRRDAYADMLRNAPQDPTDEFDSLVPDTGEEARQSLAERMVPYIRRVLDEHPELAGSDAPPETRSAARIAAAALQELYNSAQADVLRRVRRLLATDVRSNGA